MTTDIHPIDPETVSYIHLINNIPVGIFRTTFEGRLVFCNNALTRLFAFDSYKDLLGFPVSDLYQDRKERGILLRALMRKGHVKEYPLFLKRRDGRPISCMMTAKAVLDDDGIVVFIDGILVKVDDTSPEKADYWKGANNVGEMEKDDSDELMTRAKHQGMVELAGGVAHTLNQHLMIINNLSHDISETLRPGNPLYAKMHIINSQLRKLNAAIRKIGKGKNYEIMEYISGEKIVDLEKTTTH